MTSFSVLVATTIHNKTTDREMIYSSVSTNFNYKSQMFIPLWKP